MFARLTVAFACLLLAALPRVAAAQYSPQDPPPASFVFAGPVTDTDAAGATTVGFKYTLVIVALAPTRIEIVDAATGAVLVDDPAPRLAKSALTHPRDASIPVFEWTGTTPAETVTDAAPAWLHAPGDTRVQLELRVHTADAPIFSLRQPATYASAAKAAILRAVEYNRPQATAVPPPPEEPPVVPASALPAQGLIEDAQPLGYATPAEALAQVRTRPGVSCEAIAEGMQSCGEREALTIWYLFEAGHPLSPTVVRRRIADDGIIRTTVSCGATEAACAQLRANLTQMSTRP